MPTILTPNGLDAIAARLQPPPGSGEANLVHGDTRFHADFVIVRMFEGSATMFAGLPYEGSNAINIPLEATVQVVWKRPETTTETVKAIITAMTRVGRGNHVAICIDGCYFNGRLQAVMVIDEAFIPQKDIPDFEDIFLPE